MFSKWIDIEGLSRHPELLSPNSIIAVSEKIHGTSVRFGFADGNYRAGGRNEEFDFENTKPKGEYGFMTWIRANMPVLLKVKELSLELGKDIIVYGEWFGMGVQGEIKYLNSGKDFRMFGLKIGDELEDWDKIAEIAAMIGVKTVPLLYRGVPNFELLENLRVSSSRLAAENGIDDPQNLSEGVVITPIPMVKTGRYYTVAKFKNQKFAERTSERSKTITPLIISDKAIGFVNEFWTLERLKHVLASLVEKGLDTSSDSIIGHAIKAMFEDVIKEGKPEWDTLGEDDRKIIGRNHPKKTKELLEKYRYENLVAQAEA